jgi:hypothetical protein
MATTINNPTVRPFDIWRVFDAPRELVWRTCRVLNLANNCLETPEFFLVQFTAIWCNLPRKTVSLIFASCLFGGRFASLSLEP